MNGLRALLLITAVAGCVPAPHPSAKVDKSDLAKAGINAENAAKHTHPPKANGGPAIDFSRWDYAGTYSNLTVRDYFAGQALAGLVSTTYYGEYDKAAAAAYAHADAMLAERAK